MQVKFVGAINGVSGSCSHLKHVDSGVEFLVDCGMNQDGKNAEFENSRDFPFIPKNIKYVLLTHAHLDHCGLIPRLYKEGFIGGVYCTKATAGLAKIVMEDCAKIGGIYKFDDVNKVRFFYVDSDDSKSVSRISLENGLRFIFSRSGHILGSCGITVNWGFSKEDPKGKSIHFSGDVGSNFESNCYLPLLKHNHLPFPDVDYILTESTYGGRIRDDKYKSSRNRLDSLRELIDETVLKNNGKLIIPSFSIHRTQEIMVDLYCVLSEEEMKKKIDDHIDSRDGYAIKKFAVYVNSSMGSKANTVFAKELLSKLDNGKYKYKNNSLLVDDSILLQLFESGFYKFNDDTCYIKVMDGNNKVESSANNGSIFVASSGMCDAGAITKYLKLLGDDPNNTIVITGYQSRGSRGFKILNESDPHVKANVADMSGYYSAHADESGLLDYIFSLDGYDQKNKHGTTVFINHGTDESKSALSSSLRCRADINNEGDRKIKNVVVLSEKSNYFDLDSGEMISVSSRDFSTEYMESLGFLHDKVDRLTELVESLLINKQ